MDRNHFFHDEQTGVPTLLAALDELRHQIVERGELLVLYFNFRRYSKIEEIYGWEKLDQVLTTTASAMRAHLAGTPLANAALVVPSAGDDDFMLLHVPPPATNAMTEAQLTELVT
ncbi:MAG TPA: hypothetical protein VFZ56_06020, partial [Gemmatimonadaceae bacterium]